MAEQNSDKVESNQTAVAPTKPKPADNKKVSNLPPFNVILLNDDDHSYEYVVEMLKALFGHTEQMGFVMAKEVDERGRVVVLTTHKEKAELKRDQIHAYGTDIRVATCQGSMSAMIEPAESPT